MSQDLPTPALLMLRSRPTHAPLTPHSRPAHAPLTPCSRPSRSRPTHAPLTFCLSTRWLWVTKPITNSCCVYARNVSSEPCSTVRCKRLSGYEPCVWEERRRVEMLQFGSNLPSNTWKHFLILSSIMLSTKNKCLYCN